jgi:acetoin utilization deacetylase AcuC-like enzyme
MRKTIIVTLPENDTLIAWEKTTHSNNKPFTRHKIILEELANFDMDFTELKPEDIPFAEQLLTNLGVSEDYLMFLKTAYESFKDASYPEDFKSIDSGLVSYIYAKTPSTNTLKPYLKTGIYGNDTFTHIYSHTYETALASAASGMVAVEFIGKYNIVYVPTIFPGHHATNNSFSGYCFLNNAALIAKFLLAASNNDPDFRVAILDIDFHHGDGTQKIFHESKNVSTYSIHGHPENEYPFYTGYESENTDNNTNYPQKGGFPLSDYTKLLAKILAEINKKENNILIIAFGADTYRHDPEVRPDSRFSLDIADYHTIGQTISKHWDKPIIVTQEGGYFLENVGKIVHSFLTGLSSPILNLSMAS